jgi:hypothetical protein
MSIVRSAPQGSASLNKQGQHAGKSIQRTFMDLAVGEKSDQREVAQHGMDESNLLRVVAKLMPATAQAGDIHTPFDGRWAALFQLPQHALHVLHGRAAIAFAKDNLVVVLQVIADGDEL